MYTHFTMGESMNKELFTAGSFGPVTKPSPCLMIACLIRRTARSSVSYNDQLGGGFMLTLLYISFIVCITFV